MTLNYGDAHKIYQDLLSNGISCSIIDSMQGRMELKFEKYEICTLIIRVQNEINYIRRICNIVDKHGISCKMDILEHKVLLH